MITETEVNNDQTEQRQKAYKTIKSQLMAELGIMNKKKLERLANLCLCYYESGYDSGRQEFSRIVETKPLEKKLIITG